MGQFDPLTLEDQYVIFSLDGNDFALPVGIVDRIIRAVNITAVPGAQENVLGVINLHGQAVPVFNLRKIFNLPSGEIKLSDLYILVRMSGRTVAIIADSVKVITDRKDKRIVPASKIFPGMEKILEGLIFLEDGTVLIYDPVKLFTLQDLSKIDMKVLGKKIKKIHGSEKKVPPESQRNENKSIRKTKHVKSTVTKPKVNKRVSKN